MQMKVVDEGFTARMGEKFSSPKLHAVTPDVKLKAWDGVPPYAVWAFLGYLMLLGVIFSDQIVPYCEANFAQPQNCAPLFGKILPVFAAGIILVPALSGAVRRMGGNAATSLAFAFCAAVMPVLILGWNSLF